MHEVKRIIKEATVSGPGPDDISMKLIKEGSELLAPLLTAIFNQCFTSGTYPDAFKVAKLVPIYKGGERSKLDNYRPVSILNALNKIMEKIVYNQMLQHIENINTRMRVHRKY